MTDNGSAPQISNLTAIANTNFTLTDSVTIFGLRGNDTLKGGKSNHLLVAGSGTNPIGKEAGYDFFKSTNDRQVSLSNIRLQNVSMSAEFSTLSNMEAAYLLGKTGNDLMTAILLMLITFLVTRLLKD